MQSSLRVGVEAAAGDFLVKQVYPSLDTQDMLAKRPVVIDMVHGLIGVVIGEKVLGKPLGIKKLVGVGAGIAVAKYFGLGEMALPKGEDADKKPTDSQYADAFDAGVGAAVGNYVFKMAAGKKQKE